MREEKVDVLIDEEQQRLINARASQLDSATQKENLGLAIKHQDVATIRKVGDSLALTDDQLKFIISEIKKCRKDIVYFANTYFRIIGDGGLQIIKLYPKQREMLEAMQRERRLIVLSPRQAGKSTTYSIYFLWQAMFFPDKRIAIASDAAAKAREILNRIKLAYEYLPKEIKPAVTAYNSDQLSFDNNSEIRAFATGGNSLAGFSCVTGDTKVTIADDFGGIWYTDIDKVELIANSSIPVDASGMDELTMKKYNFVYKTINTISGKEYIGVHSTDNLNDGYLGSGDAIKAAIEKYGPECFTRSIVKMCENRQEALRLGDRYISKKSTYSRGLGERIMQVLTESGFSTFHGVRISRSDSLLVLKSENNELICTPDHKVKLSNGSFAEVRCLSPGAKLAGGKSVKDIVSIPTGANVYDLLEVENGHEYLTNGITSHNCDTLALDEFALIRWSIADTFFRTTMPVLSSRKNSKAIIVSTPRGTVKNKYYDLWSAANSSDQSNNREGWVPFRLDWWDVPGRDEDWKRKQIAEIGIENFRQEFGCEFSSSGTALLVPDDKITQFRRCINSVKDPAEINLQEDDTKPPINARVWEVYDPNKVYGAAADISEGTGNDASVLYIFDITKPKMDENGENGVKIVAAISSSSCGVLDFANASKKLLYQYNWPVVIVENNGVGAGYVEALLDTLKVPSERIFSDTKSDGTVRYGLHSSNAVKLEACLFARELLTTAEIGFHVPDKSLLDEMGTFIRKATFASITYAAAGGAHDDHIMSFIWGLYLLHYKHIERFYRVKEAFKTKQGQVLPAELENISMIEPAEEIKASAFYKVASAILSGDASKIDPSLLSVSSLAPAKDSDTADDLYYGSSGRGGALNNKIFIVNNDQYSRFDTDDGGEYDPEGDRWDTSWLIPRRRIPPPLS